MIVKLCRYASYCEQNKLTPNICCNSCKIKNCSSRCLESSDACKFSCSAEDLAIRHSTPAALVIPIKKSLPEPNWETFENVRVCDFSKKFGMPYSTVSHLLKNKKKTFKEIYEEYINVSNRN